MARGVRQRHSHRQRRHRPAAIRRRRSPERIAASRSAAHRAAGADARPSSSSPATIRTDFSLLAVSGLIGTAAGFLACALPGQMQKIVLSQGTLHAPYPLSNLAIGGFLLSLAGGLLLPLILQRWMRRGLAQSPDPTGQVAGRPGGNFDLVQGWLVLASLGLCAGLTIILLPSWQRLLAEFHASLHAAFVWSDAPLAIVHSLIAVANSAGPALLLGLALFGVLRLGGEKRTIVVPPIVGASAAALTTSVASPLILALNSGVLQMGAALPALVAAIVAGVAAARPRQNAPVYSSLPPLSGAAELPMGRMLAAPCMLPSLLFFTGAAVGRAPLLAGVYLLAFTAVIRLRDEMPRVNAWARIPMRSAMVSGVLLLAAGWISMTTSLPALILTALVLGAASGWTWRASNWEKFAPGIGWSSGLACTLGACAAMIVLSPIALHIASATIWMYVVAALNLSIAARSIRSQVDSRAIDGPVRHSANHGNGTWVSPSRAS